VAAALKKLEKWRNGGICARALVRVSKTWRQARSASDNAAATAAWRGVKGFSGMAAATALAACCGHATS
jgi:hypothetical protein